jgi:catalase
LSQTPVEQGHIASAFIFELSKVETPAIRARMVSHLRNVDEALAKKVADGLRLKEMPKAAEPARPVITDLPASPKLSILANPPGTFKGRKLGVLVSDGVDAGLLQALQAAFKQEGAVVKLVAPMVGGVEVSDGSWVAADEKIDGGPSVVFDAVAVLLSEAGAQLLADESTARVFVADAFAHCKFIGHNAAAMPLLQKAGIAASRDSGVIPLGGPADAAKFLEACRQLRLWEREAKVKRV